MGGNDLFLNPSLKKKENKGPIELGEGGRGQQGGSRHFNTVSQTCFV